MAAEATTTTVASWAPSTSVSPTAASAPAALLAISGGVATAWTPPRMASSGALLAKCSTATSGATTNGGVMGERRGGPSSCPTPLASEPPTANSTASSAATVLPGKHASSLAAFSALTTDIAPSEATAASMAVAGSAGGAGPDAAKAIGKISSGRQCCCSPGTGFRRRCGRLLALSLCWGEAPRRLLATRDVCRPASVASGLDPLLRWTRLSPLALLPPPPRLGAPLPTPCVLAAEVGLRTSTDKPRRERLR
mmetsp:Transcript_99330/g.249081  ORF Transcript_99330/g.249081 Transcript_99330/m.249081 type:complete len:252 (-) Transcript_99330:446-1201(-)